MAMSDEELRALLAEARQWAVAVQDDSLRQRIDAALAEPVSDVTEALLEQRDTLREHLERANERTDEVRRERDEARAELVRVGRAEFDRGARQGVDQALWASRTAQETAYQRGAEAMREAAAVRIDAEGINGCTGPFFGNIIRALPVPEDKP